MRSKILIFPLMVLLFFTNIVGTMNVRAATIDNFVLPLTFTPKQVIVNPTKPIVYAIDSTSKKVYAINYETKSTTSIQLDLTPERLYFANNELYIALLKSGHVYYSTSPEEGAIAIVDPDSFKLKDKFTIDIDPFDFVVDNNGFIYVSGGSNQHTNIKSYSEETKIKASSSTSLDDNCYTVLNSTLNKIYTITTNVSPRDISAYPISSGAFTTAGYDSPYHGDYEMNTLMKISPDGKYIFNSIGTIFTCSSDKSTDMKYYKSLNSSFTDIDFDLENNKFYTSTGRKITVYDYTTLQPISLFTANNTISSLFSKDDKIIAVTKDLNDKYYIEGLNKYNSSNNNNNSGGNDNTNNTSNTDNTGNAAGNPSNSVSESSTNSSGSTSSSSNVGSSTPNSADSLPLGVTYQTHVQNVGWQSWVNDGNLAGTEGKGLRVEGINIKLSNSSDNMRIKYQAHVQNVGWQDWVHDGGFAGTEGKSYRVEAIRIQLENAPGYSVQYQVHVQNIGWQDWVQDGDLAGTEGKSLRIEAIRIRIVKSDFSIAYQGHVQNVGWQDWVQDGALSGTEGQSLRVEGLKIRLLNAPSGAKIRYQAHVQNIGWQDFSNDSELSGTSGKSYRIEAIRILLENAPGYSVQYQTHVQNIGWQDWVNDGLVSGTTGEGLRIEAIRIKIVKSGNSMWNIANKGQVVQQNNWIYYSDPSYNGALYKSNYDGSQKTKLSDDNANFINIIDDWIYYSNASDKDNVYKIKIDGTERTKLNDVKSEYIHVVGDKIYYSDPTNNYAVYKMNLNGTNTQSYDVSPADYIFMSSEDLYIAADTGDKGLYRYVFSKNSVQNKVADSPIDFNVTEDMVFYTSSLYGNSLCKSTPYGQGPMLLNHVDTRYISVIGDWLYFNNASDNYRLYRIRKDGVGMELFSS